jgi:DNA polymerase IV (archaeal DinB-like DNA polymerase)
MDYFYAQVEERRRPMAKGKIIAVCMFSGRTEDSGVISTVNYAGREVGIHSGMPIALAKKRAPPADSLFIPADREYYAEISMQIDELIHKSCKKVVQASIDEWNCQDDEAIAKAPALKKLIKDALGLNCSIGVAPSLLGAKMAASKSKPDGLLVLDTESERKMIDGSDVKKVPGIGNKTSEALAQIGIRRVGELKNADPIMLVESFGRKTGAWLNQLGLGNYVTELGQEKEQEEVSRIGTLKDKTRDVHNLIVKVDGIEKEAREWLMHMKKSFRTLSIIFVTEDMKIHTKSMSFKNPMPWNADITDEKKELIENFLKENNLMVRRIGIRFGNFMDLGGQTTLF